MEEVEISLRDSKFDSKISKEILEFLIVNLGKNNQLCKLNLDFNYCKFDTKKISEEAIANGFQMLKTLNLGFWVLKGGQQQIATIVKSICFSRGLEDVTINLGCNKLSN